MNTADFYLLQGIALRSFQLTDSCLSTSDSGEIQELSLQSSRDSEMVNGCPLAWDPVGPSGTPDSGKWETCWRRSSIPYSHLREVGRFNLTLRWGCYTFCTQGNHFMQFGITIGHVLFIPYTGCEIEYSAIFWQRKPAFSPKLGTASIQQLAAFLTMYYRVASVHYILNPICTVSLCATHTTFFYITSCNLSY